MDFATIIAIAAYIGISIAVVIGIPKLVKKLINIRIKKAFEQIESCYSVEDFHSEFDSPNTFTEAHTDSRDFFCEVMHWRRVAMFCNGRVIKVRIPGVGSFGIPMKDVEIVDVKELEKFLFVRIRLLKMVQMNAKIQTFRFKVWKKDVKILENLGVL